MSLLLGCGTNYRPVVSAISPVGPAEQPSATVVALATTGPNTPGVVDLEDAFGDTIVDLLSINNDPRYLAPGNGNGSTAYSVNNDGTVNYFSTGPTTLSADVKFVTLPSNADPTFILSTTGTFTYITEPGANGRASYVASLQPLLPPTLRQEIPVPPNPVYIAGIAASPRVYAVSEGATGAPNGQVTAIEVSTNTVSNTITVGKTPVFDLMTIDGKRTYVLNKGDGTVSAINVQTNALDSFHDPVTNALTSTFRDPAAVAPLWADLAPTLNELLVLNAGVNNTANGTVSIFSIPLCSVTAVVSNPNCDLNNPVDAVGFGALIANIPVGVNPIQIRVLQDGSEAFVANAGNSTTPGSVTVINLRTNTVIATIPASADGACNPTNPTAANPLTVCGHPIWMDGLAGSPTGKVFIVSSDSTNMSVIRSDINAVSTQIPLSGFGVSVKVSQ